MLTETTCRHRSSDYTAHVGAAFDQPPSNTRPQEVVL